MLALLPAKSEPTAYLPTKLQGLKAWATLFPAYPTVHVLESSPEPFAMGPAAQWCGECQEEIYPLPLSNPEKGWFLPCHEQECSNCYNHPHASEVCQNCNACEFCDTCMWCDSCQEKKNGDTFCGECDYCGDCCKCNSCSHCGDKFKDYSHAYQKCDEDDECELCNSCCSGHESRREEEASSASGTAPWLRRGDTMPASADTNAYTLIQEEAQLRQLDPVQAMADFYLADYVRTILTFGFKSSSLNNGSRQAHLLKQAATTLQDSIVQRADDLFQIYTFCAIGGEVRHHGSIRGEIPSGRSDCWDYWLAMGEVGNRQALTQDCVDLFSDGNWGGSYGGYKWQVIAETLLARLQGVLDPRTFVDRIFSLQHNGGSLLNKVEWPHLTAPNHYVNHCKYIGNAHAAEQIGFAVLLESASEDAQALVQSLMVSFGPWIPDNDKQALELAAYAMGWKEQTLPDGCNGHFSTYKLKHDETQEWDADSGTYVITNPCPIHHAPPTPKATQPCCHCGHSA